MPRDTLLSMIKHAFFILTLNICTFSSLSVSAESNISYVKLLGELQYLISQKQYEEAYSKGKLHYEYLGEPDFDYILGISALKSGVSAPAVFAFERVVEDKPNWYEARLYLIRSYIAANNLPAANSQALALINAPKPPDRIKTAAQTLLASSQTKQRLAGRSYSQSIELGYGVDSNVNAGTSEESIIIPNLGEFLLSEQSKSTDDNYAKLNYVGRYSHPVDQHSTLLIGVNADWYKFDELSQYDRISSNVSARYQHQRDKTLWHIQANVAPLLLDGQLYRTESSVSGGANYQLNKQASIFSALTVGVMNNAFDDKLDNSFYAFNLGAGYLGKKSYQSVTTSFKNESANIDEGEFNAKQITGIYYQANVLLSPQWQLLAQSGYQWIEHQSEHPLFLEERSDKLLILSSKLKYLANKNLALQLGLNYQDKTSNLSLFEYDRFDTNLSARYSF